MQKSVPCKISIALAISTGIACALSVAPGAVCAIFVLVVIAVLLLALCVYFFGGIFWLISAGNWNIFPFGKSCFQFAGGIFDFLEPFAKFCFTYITPVVVWVTLGVGIITVIFSIVTIAKSKKAITLSASNTDIAVEAELVQETESRYPDPRAKRKGKRRKKREKTEKGTGILCLVLAIVFVVVAFVVLFATNLIVPT